MALINSFLVRLCAIVLFVSTLSDGYQSLERVTERLDNMEGELKEISEDLKETLRRESRYRREDIKAIHEILKQFQGDNPRVPTAYVPGNDDVKACKSCQEEATSSKDNSFVILLKAFKREKQINKHLRAGLINFQNKLEDKIANVSKETINNAADEISSLRNFRDRLNENVTVKVRGIEDRLMSQLDQEKSSIRTTLSEVNVDLRAINDSFSEEIRQCFEKMSNQTKILDNLRANMFDHSEKLKEIPKHMHIPTLCNEVVSNESKMFAIYLKELNQIVPVFCDFDTDGGGWIVFQRRINDSEDFHRTWEDYKLGFGDQNGNFWWGNEKLHLMTMDEPMELRIDFEDFDGTKAFAKYSSFRIRSEEQKYSLEVGGYSGSAGDSLVYEKAWGIHNGKAFSTHDRDNDQWSGNCASLYGGWWFAECLAANLNGNYVGKEQSNGIWQGIQWYTFRQTTSLKFAEMKFRLN